MTKIVQVIPRGLGGGFPWQNHGINAAGLDTALSILNPEWWHDWKFGQIGRPGYFPSLWRCSRTTTAYIAEFNLAVAAAKTNPDILWFLGNEPERRDQSNTGVHTFTRAVKAFRKALPGTPIALPGVMVTDRPNDPGMYWLAGYNKLVQAEPEKTRHLLIPDYIHYHNYAYVWEEWRNNHDRVRSWARAAGWPDLMIVTEAAWAGGGEQTMQSDLGNLSILDRVKRAIKVSDIRAGAWMSSQWHDWPGPASNLLTGSYSLTTIGKEFVKP